MFISICIEREELTISIVAINIESRGGLLNAVVQFVPNGLRPKLELILEIVTHLNPNHVFFITELNTILDELSLIRR